MKQEMSETLMREVRSNFFCGVATAVFHLHAKQQTSNTNHKDPRHKTAMHLIFVLVNFVFFSFYITASHFYTNNVLFFFPTGISNNLQ